MKKPSKAALEYFETSRYLVFKDAKSHKFWCIFADQDEWVVMWGKEGKAPQQSQRVDYYEAQRRLREKLGKSYKEQERTEFLARTLEENPGWFHNTSLSPAFLAVVEHKRILEALDEAEKTKALDKQVEQLTAKRTSMRL